MGVSTRGEMSDDGPRFGRGRPEWIMKQVSLFEGIETNRRRAEPNWYVRAFEVEYHE